MQKKTKQLILSLGVIGFFALLFSLRSHQDNSNPAIRILLDRYPNRQSVDVAYRRLLPLLEEFHYTLHENLNEEKMRFTPPNSSLPLLEFQVVRDELTRALLFLRGDADVLYDSLSIAKTEWVKKKYPEIQIFKAEGDHLSFLGFNFRHEILTHFKVRQAIAASLPIKVWSQQKLFNWVTPVEDAGIPSFQPEKARALLDEAGYPQSAHGPRFKLQYFTTPVREGNELAFLVREALKDVGIEVEVTTLETVRFSKQDSISVFLDSQGARNYSGFSDPDFEKVFRRNESSSYDDLKALIAQKLPLIPLYNWKHGLVLSGRIHAPESISSHLDETFRFLTDLRIK